MRTRVIIVAVAVVLCCGARAQSPSPQPRRLTLQLEPNTPGHPAAAYIREQRFVSVDELKAYIAGLPPGTHIFFRWWTDSHHQQSPFYIARGELRKFCAERSVEFRIDTAPFW